MEKIVDEEPHLPLRDITEKVIANISKTTIDKILSDAGSRLLIPRREPFWRARQKRKRVEFANRRKNWGESEWGRVVFVDEATFEYDPNPKGLKIRARPGEELEEIHRAHLILFTKGLDDTLRLLLPCGGRS